MQAGLIIRSIWVLACTFLVACDSSDRDPVHLDAGGDTNEVAPGPFNLATGFGLATRSGTTTGDTPLSNCTGFFPEQPSLVMTLENTFIGLTVRASSDQALLAITRGVSVFCGQGTPSTVSRESWEAGEYRILVGTPGHDRTASFIVTVSE